MRHRPVIAVRVSSPTASILRDALVDTWSHQTPWTSLRATASILRDALVDTGADDTIFPDDVAALLGVDLSGAPQISIHLAGRGTIACRYAQVTFRISDGVSETYEWEAVVGFVSVPIHLPLLGHAGCLQFFDASFLGAHHELVLLPNHSFSGRRL